MVVVGSSLGCVNYPLMSVFINGGICMFMALAILVNPDD
jgi:hypothetical protein